MQSGTDGEPPLLAGLSARDSTNPAWASMKPDSLLLNHANLFLVAHTVHLLQASEKLVCEVDTSAELCHDLQLLKIVTITSVALGNSKRIIVSTSLSCFEF